MRSSVDSIHSLVVREERGGGVRLQHQQRETRSVVGCEKKTGGQLAYLSTVWVAVTCQVSGIRWCGLTGGISPCRVPSGVAAAEQAAVGAGGGGRVGEGEEVAGAAEGGVGQERGDGAETCGKMQRVAGGEAERHPGVAERSWGRAMDAHAQPVSLLLLLLYTTPESILVFFFFFFF